MISSPGSESVIHIWSCKLRKVRFDMIQTTKTLD